MRSRISPLLSATISTLVFSFSAHASQGFSASDNPNVFNYRGSPNGATASLVNLPDGSQVLASQAHVVEAFQSGVHLTWGKFYGWDWKEWAASKDAFELAFTPSVLWKDDELDIEFVAVPAGLTSACRCSGLDIASFRPGPAIMIGYPETGRRTYPLIGYYWKAIGTLTGTVRQRASRGSTWVTNGEYVADIDGLPGDSIWFNDSERLGSSNRHAPPSKGMVWRRLQVQSALNQSAPNRRHSRRIQFRS